MAIKTKPERLDFTASIPEDLFFDAHEGAVAGMAKRDPTAYGIVIDGKEYRFTDKPLNQFTFALLHHLEKHGEMDRYPAIHSRYDLLYRIVRGGKLGPHLTYRDGNAVAIHRAAFNVAASFPIVRHAFKRKTFIAAVEVEFARLEAAA